MSIYNSLKNCGAGNLFTPENLQKISDLLYRQKGLKVEFCEIIGKRWNHLAGHPEFWGVGERYVLTENLGIIVEEASETLDETKQIIEWLKKQFAAEKQ